MHSKNYDVDSFVHPWKKHETVGESRTVKKLNTKDKEARWNPYAHKYCSPLVFLIKTTTLFFTLQHLNFVYILCNKIVLYG
jgi:hypothetical protein